MGYQIKTYSDDLKVIGHSGMNEGWKAQFSVVPSLNKGIVILTNSDRGMDLINDITSLWLAENTGEKRIIFHSQFDRYIVLFIAMILMNTLAILIITNIKKIKMGKRKRISKISLKFILKVLIVGLLLLGWYISLYTGICFVKYLPFTFKWISISFIVWMIYLIVLSFYPKTKEQVN